MTDRFRILVLDDQRPRRLATAQELQSRGYEAEPVESAPLAHQQLAAAHWDVVLADLDMAGVDGMELLRQLRERYPSVAVILTTARATIDGAVAAIQAGASDYLARPWRVEDLDARLRRLSSLAASRNELSLHRYSEADGAGIIGRSQTMVDVLQRIHSLADHDAPVLVTGETGTGKELVARALHQQGRRRTRPFLAIACDTMGGELAESELFGHEKGAVPGARERRIGSIERAHEGTILLDDVDQLPLNIQVKLLGLLQDGSFFRVGGTEEVRIDVRVVATSKVDLGQAVRNGTFRDDLFYRLRGLEITLPRLADRGEDVLLLAQHFLRVLTARAGQASTRITLSSEAAQRLCEYSWPGNVRELRRAMESAAIVAAGNEIRPEHLPSFLAREAGVHHDVFSLHLERLERVPFNELLERFQDELIHWALGRAGGQQKRAADLLGIPRTTLQSRMLRLREAQLAGRAPQVECHP